MDAGRSLARPFSDIFPPVVPNRRKINPNAAEVSLVCARAGVSYVGIAADRVVFQPVGTSLSIPLAEFRDAERAAALIRAKLAEVQR